MSRKKFPKGSFFSRLGWHGNCSAMLARQLLCNVGTPNAYRDRSKSLIIRGLQLGRGPLAALKCLYSTSYVCQAFNSKSFLRFVKHKIKKTFFNFLWGKTVFVPPYMLCLKHENWEMGSNTISWEKIQELGQK